MSLEDLNLLQSSSEFTNGTKNQNYLMICITHPTAPLIWAAYSMFCFLLGIPASIMVLRELCQRRQENTSNDFFVFNLTVFDLTFLSMLPLNVANYLVWQNNKIECFCNSMYTLCMSGRPLFMALCCGEYFFAVVHPITYMASKRTAMIRKLTATAIWLITICFGLLIIIQPWVLTTAIINIPLFIALPIICFCDISVYRVLRRKDPTGKTVVHPQKRRAMRTIISSFVMTFIAYLPPAVIFSIGRYIHMSFDDYNCVLMYLGVCFTVLGCVIMPFMYLESIGLLNLQKMLKKLKLKG